MNPIFRLESWLPRVAALLAGATLCSASLASVAVYQFTDDKDSTNYYASAASLTLTDFSDATLGSGVKFTLQATLTDPIFGAGSKIADLAFNGPVGVFNNFSDSNYSAYRGGVMVAAMSYTGGDGATTGGIRFNWTDTGSSFGTSGSNAFTNNKTSKWFIGDTTVAQFGAAEFQNPFAALHVSALVTGGGVWLLDGAPPVAVSVPEPKTGLLVLTALSLVGMARRRHNRVAAGT